MSSCRRGEGNLEGIHEDAGNGRVRAQRTITAPRSASSTPLRARRAEPRRRQDALRARLIEAAVELLAESSVPRLDWTEVTPEPA
jgi:hypothetical protein